METPSSGGAAARATWKARGKIAALSAVAAGVAFAAGRLSRARPPAPSSAGAAELDPGHRGGYRARGWLRGDESVMAGAESSEPISALRFGEQDGLMATEDAANPPDEALSANNRFANEIRDHAPAHPGSL